jgi:ABC-2 family transporter protein
MLPGPVFNIELVTTARRARYYVVRVVYGLILLFLVWAHYINLPGGPSGLTAEQMSPQKMAELADRVFATFTITQGLMVLAITPALVAGVIVTEKQRKTLQYLLASRLSSGEIVLGKLAARLLHLGVLVCVGLPIMSLLSLFGGVDPNLVLLAYAGTLSLAFFLAGLSIWVSTIANKVREALVLAYMIELVWLAAPPIIDAVTRFKAPALYPWVKPVNDLLLASLPHQAIWQLGGGGGGPSLAPIVWMIGLQLIYGALFVALSVWRLRPIFRAQEGRENRWGRLGASLQRWRWRLLPRPACGTQPMLWKELFVSQSSGLVKLLSVVMSIGLFGFLAYWVVVLGSAAFTELISHGYTGTDAYRNRAELNMFIRIVGTFMYVVWILAIAGHAASTVSSEREQDTWISLISTPLGSEEILGAKLLGSVWSTRGLGCLILLLWSIGLLAGSVHPLGFLAAVTELAVFTWFATSLGTFISLHSKTTLRAQAATIAILLGLNVGYMMCCIPLQANSAIIILGCTPYLQSISLLSYEDVRSVFDAASPGFRLGRYRESTELFIASIGGLLGYGVAAFSLMAGSVTDFDRIVDRPRYPTEIVFEPTLEKPVVGDLSDDLGHDEVGG